jgi:hypothetical protein
MQGSTKKPSFLDEIQLALQGILFGSVEIYVQDGVITQATARHIKKTKLEIPKEIKKADKK